MVKDIHSVGLNVVDLEKAIDFYCTEDAFTLVEHFAIANNAETRAAYGMDNPEGRGALLRGHASFLELISFNDTGVPRPDCREVYDPGLRHICMRAQDVHGLFDNLEKAGSRWHARPAELGTGLEYAYVRDPEGNLLELEGLSMMPPGVMKPWFDHIAIVTPDINRLAHFYEVLTETAVSRRGSFGPEAKFDTVAGIQGIVFEGAWILFGLSRVEMWQYANPKTTQRLPRAAQDIGWSHLCLEVDDLEAQCDRLTAAGIEFLGEPMHSGMGRCRFLRDVDGNRIKLLQIADGRSELSMSNLASKAILRQIREASEGTRKSH